MRFPLFTNRSGLLAGVAATVVFAMPCAVSAQDAADPDRVPGKATPPRTKKLRLTIQSTCMAAAKSASALPARRAKVGLPARISKCAPCCAPASCSEATPGLIATQHSGGGKANQYFLRGFNLDHGTDFSLYVDDMPMNFRTHGHGQGYLDVNGLIPEAVERVDYRKGPTARTVATSASSARRRSPRATRWSPSRSSRSGSTAIAAPWQAARSSWAAATCC